MKIATAHCPDRPGGHRRRRPARKLGWALAWALLGWMLWGPAFAAPGAPDPEPEGARHPGAIHLVVLHTNDVHGQALARPATWSRESGREVGGLARVAAYVRQVRAEHTGRHRGVLVLDGGDWFQGTPEGQLDGGWPFVEAMAAVGYDALVVGNHEWDLGEANLRRVLRRSRVPAVLANVRVAADGPRFDGCPPWRIVLTGGLRVAVVGLILPQTPSITHADAARFHFERSEDALAAVLAELPSQVDLVLPLTHIGVEQDRALARAFPELPLIVGGHSHSFLPEGVREGETLIVQAGSRATVIGRVDLWIDPRTRRVLESEARLIELPEGPEPRWRNGRVERLLAGMTARVEARMGEVLGELAEAGPAGGPLVSSGLGNWITDAMARGTGAEIAVHNRGGIRAALAPGKVTRRHLFEVAPFDNTVVVLELGGAQVESLVRRGFEGTGRRGFEFSGMEVAVRLRGETTEVRAVTVAGQPLDPERFYRVATNSFLAAGGDRLFEGLEPRSARDSGKLLRDVLEAEVVAAGRFHLPPESRIRLAEEGPEVGAGPRRSRGPRESAR